MRLINMACVLTDGVRFIGKNASNKDVIVNSVDDACMYSSDVKATNALNSLPKKLKIYKFRVAFVIKENQTKKVAPEDDGLSFDIMEKIHSLRVDVEELGNRRLILINKIHNLDLEIVDIEHAAEFYDLNAAQGYKLYRLLHDARCKRRKYKDELEKINYLLNTPLTADNLLNVEKSIIGVDSKKYAPRALSELFK